MFNREFRVKKSLGAFLLKGIFSLVMFLLSLCCCLLPKIFGVNADYTLYILIVGILGCVYFSFFFMMVVISGIKPADALVLTESGIYDFVTYPGKGLFIDWENVSSVKIIGSEKCPILGIELYDTEIFLGTVKKSIGNEIRANIEAGLPAIVIKQSDLATRLSQITPAFNDFINATRPIPKTEKLSGLKSYSNVDNYPSSTDADNDIAVINKVKVFTADDISDEELLILPATSASMLSIPAESKTIKAAKKEMDEIFVLPPERNFDLKNKKSFMEAKQKFNFDDAFENKQEDAIPLFSEFVLESKPIEIQKTTKNEMKELPVVEKKTVAEEKKSKPDIAEQKIQTLDELLSSFSVPVLEKEEKTVTTIKPQAQEHFFRFSSLHFRQ